MPKRVRVVVSGDVQGVGFRWYCREQARARDVKGFVRNLSDGGVEAAFEGTPESVEAMVTWCREGPTWARVKSVDVTEEEPEGLQDFRITRV
jgi:acylphosphatase